MKKLPAKNLQGFASVLSILVIIFLVVSGLALYGQSKNSPSFSYGVLSESDDEAESPESSGEPEDEVEDEDEENETPEPDETAEPEETEEPEEFEEEEEFEINEGTSESKIKIRSGKNKFEFQQEGSKFSIESSFPLSVNPDTRELTVTTPAGSRVVAVLPQEAVDNMVAAEILTTTAGIDLKIESDGKLSYHIEGVKDEKLLGIFDVTVPKNLVISAETGQLLTIDQSIFSKILDILSV